jgi:hypothetical protein
VNLQSTTPTVITGRAFAGPFYRAGFGHVRYTHSTFKNVQFLECDLKHVTFYHCTFTNCSWVHSRFRECSWDKCVFYPQRKLTIARFVDCAMEACAITASPTIADSGSRIWESAKKNSLHLDDSTYSSLWRKLSKGLPLIAGSVPSPIRLQHWGPTDIAKRLSADAESLLLSRGFGVVFPSRPLTLTLAPDSLGRGLEYLPKSEQAVIEIDYN